MERTEVTPDPKGTPRVRLTPAKYRELVDAAMLRALGFCECGCGRAAHSAHHLIGRGQGGDDVAANIVVLAGDGTRLCHGALTSGKRAWDMDRGVYVEPADVRSGIRRRLDETRRDARAYVISRKGIDWLDGHYPIG